MSDNDVYQRLAAQWPTESHKKVKKGGSEQTYVPANDVIERLNIELGVQNWSFRVVREGFTATECWVLGEITALIDGVTTVRQQYGCEPITMGQRETPTGDLLKKAGTDSVKKAATLLGVALYLSDAEERSEVEAAMREANRPKPAPKASSGANPNASPAGGAPPTPIDPERAANIEKLQKVMRMALVEGIDFEQHDPTALSNDQIESYGKALADMVRASRAAS